MRTGNPSEGGRRRVRRDSQWRRSLRTGCLEVGICREGGMGRIPEWRERVVRWFGECDLGGGVSGCRGSV